MDGIVKIVLALKLKFLLIILSIGTSYFVEHGIKKKAEPVSSIEISKQDTGLKGSGHIDVKSLFRIAEKDHDIQKESKDQTQIQRVNYFADKPFNSQGLEIYFVL